MPTIRQQKAIKILVDSGGKTPVSKAMLQAGYSPATAKTPQKLTNSIPFQKFIEALGIDKKSRLVRLADIFKTSGSREAIQANQEIAKMLGDYEPQKVALGRYKEEMEEITT